MSRMRRPGRRGVIIAAVCALVVAGGTTWILTRGDAPARERSSVAITAAEGGALEREGLATVRIPPGGISGDAVLRVTEAEEAAPDADAIFVPLGAAVSIAVDGASLTAPATVEFPVQAPDDGAARPALAPVAMYLDEAAGEWVPAESTYDPDMALVVVETLQLSTWRAFTWDVQAGADNAASLVTAAFGTDAAAEVAPPDCPRREEAEAVARVEVTSGGELPACLDLDPAGGLLLRVVSGRTLAVQVQQLDGVELTERRQQPPSSVYGGQVIAERLAGSTSFRLAVLGPGESATFRVTGLARPTGISASPTTLSYVTDVLDLGMGQLSWLLGTLGSPAAGDEDELYRTLFAGGDLSACASEGIASQGTAASASAIADLIAEVVFGCLADQTRARLTTDLRAPAYAASLLEPGLGVVADELAAGNYLDGLLSGAESVSVQVTGV